MGDQEWVLYRNCRGWRQRSTHDLKPLHQSIKKSMPSIYGPRAQTFPSENDNTREEGCNFRCIHICLRQDYENCRHNCALRLSSRRNVPIRNSNDTKVQHYFDKAAGAPIRSNCSEHLLSPSLDKGIMPSAIQKVDVKKLYHYFVFSVVRNPWKRAVSAY